MLAIGAFANRPRRPRRPWPQSGRLPLPSCPRARRRPLPRLHLVRVRHPRETRRPRRAQPRRKRYVIVSNTACGRQSALTPPPAPFHPARSRRFARSRRPGCGEIEQQSRRFLTSVPAAAFAASSATSCARVDSSTAGGEGRPPAGAAALHRKSGPAVRPPAPRLSTSDRRPHLRHRLAQRCSAPPPARHSAASPPGLAGPAWPVGAPGSRCGSACLDSSIRPHTRRSHRPAQPSSRVRNPPAGRCASPRVAPGM